MTSPDNSISLQESENAAAPRCLNCDTALLGDFCYQCGQKFDVKPFTIKTLFAALYEAVRKFDGEVRKTFLGLLIYPGRFCRRYLAGKRKAFTGPVKYFFISFVFQVTVFGLVRHVAQHPEIDEAASVDTKLQMISLAMTFFWAVAYTIIFRRERSNLAENTVCMLYLDAQIRFYLVVIQLLFLPLVTTLANEYTIRIVIGLTLSFVYFVFFSRQYFKKSFAVAAFKNFLVLLMFIIIAIPIFFLEVFIVVIYKELFGVQ